MVYCKRCESTGTPIPNKPGSPIVCPILWLISFGAVVISGITITGICLAVVLAAIACVYAGWRKRNTMLICEHRGAEEIIPADSPAALRSRWERPYKPVLGINGPSR